MLQRRLLAWYRRAHRRLPWRESGDPYAIWLSEVMLQQTQVKTVLPYYRRFLERFPDLTALAAADAAQVLECWQGLGYYARARNLQRAAQLVLQEYGGHIPRATQCFRQLPGVGAYIAAAVGSIAFGLPLAVVDGNVKRVLARLLAIDTPINAPTANGRFQTAADKLLNRRQPGLHNQALMELGARVCTPRRPACAQCPLSALCQAYGTGQVQELPRRLPRRRVPEQPMVLAVIWRGARLLATQRPATGLLGGLWQLPGGALQPELGPAESCHAAIRQSTGLEVAVETHLASLRHGYSHFRLTAQLFLCRWTRGRVKVAGVQAHRWVTPSQFARLPLSTLERKCLPWIASA